jgi:hypothetical protein
VPTSDILRKAAQIPFKELTAYLDEIEKCFMFMDDSNRIRPRLGGLVNWNNIDQDARNKVTSFIDQRDIRMEIFFHSLYVIVHASLELFTRELMEKSVIALNQSELAYSDIPESIQHEHIYHTGLVLQTIKKPLDHYTFDYDQLSKNLGSCFSDSKSCTLNSESFSFNIGTLTPINIERLFDRICIKIDWDLFGRNINMKKIFGVTSTRKCAKSIQEALKTMVRKRNRIVHTGGATLEVGRVELQQQLQFVPVFAEILIENIAKQIDNNLQKL